MRVRKTKGEQVKEYKFTETRKGKGDKKAGLVNIRGNIAFKEDEE